MSGMGNGLRADAPTIVSAFHRALYHQGLVVFLILAVLAVGWYGLRIARVRRAARAGHGEGPGPGKPAPEPDARRLLRIGFGLLWVLDGILQAQASMPLGMVPQVISRSTEGSPSWVQHLVNGMATTWAYHPIAAATAVVWIQIGIGVWLLVAPPGNLSRLAGIASAGWGLVIWIFGEALGGILAPGLSWLTGAPGAVLIYCFAGVLIALPEGHWRSPRLGRVILGLVGLFFVGMALLQAWPGRGFWQGRLGHSGTLGSLSSMVQTMSQTSQPHWLSSWVGAFGEFDAAHGWGVNLFVVTALALIGVAFLVGRPRLVRVAIVAATLLCLADWVLIQDLGFLGGVGTDPNSMIPIILVFVAGYLALSAVPAMTDAPPAVLATTDAASAAPATAAGAPVAPAVGPAPRPGLWQGAGAMAARANSVRPAFGRWRGRLVTDSAYAFRSLAGLAAIGVMLLGAAPMAAAAINPNADPILAEALYGPAEVTNLPTPAFSLVDQHGRTVSLANLHGKTVALTFLNPSCAYQAAAACAPVQELRLADQILGTKASRVELVAINTSPNYLKPEDLASFDRRTGLDKVGNWMYLTGSMPELRNVLDEFGVHVSGTASYMLGMMGLPHGDMAYVIDDSGRTRQVLITGDHGAESKVMTSSVGVALANAVKQVVSSDSATSR